MMNATVAAERSEPHTLLLSGMPSSQSLEERPFSPAFAAFLREEFGVEGPTEIDVVALNDIDEMVKAIPRIPVGSDGDRVLDVVSDSRTVDGVPGRVQQRQIEITRVFDSLSVLSPNAGQLYPGNVVKGRGIASGEVNPVVAPLAGATMTLTGLLFKQRNAAYSVRMKRVSLEHSQRALAALLSQGEAATTAALTYSFYRCYSAEQLAVEVGASYRSLTFKGELHAKFNSAETSTVMVVRLIQQYYTVSVEPKSPPSAFFAKGVRVRDLSDQIGADNPPVYISDVKYGRMLVFIIRSRESQKTVEAAIRASFGSLVTSGEFSTDVQMRRVLNECDMSLVVLGGSGELTVEAIAKPGRDATDSLSDLLKAGKSFSSTSPGAPIAYTLRYLSDNDVTTTTLVAPYTRDVWGPYRWVSIWVEGMTFGDDKSPKVNVRCELRRNGKLLAYGNSGHIRYYKNKPWSMPLDDMTLGDLKGRDLEGGQIVLRMEGRDGWQFNYRVMGRLENGDTYSLRETSDRLYLHEGREISTVISSGF